VSIVTDLDDRGKSISGNAEDFFVSCNQYWLLAQIANYQINAGGSVTQYIAVGA